MVKHRHGEEEWWCLLGGAQEEVLHANRPALVTLPYAAKLYLCTGAQEELAAPLI